MPGAIEGDDADRWLPGDSGFGAESSGDETESWGLGTVEEGLTPAPLYWTEGMVDPVSAWWTDMTWDEVDIVSHFLSRLSLTVAERGVLIDGNALQCLAESINPTRASSVLTEPWMSRHKAKASTAVGIVRAVTAKAVEEFGFGRIVDAGLPRWAGTTAKELEEAVFAADPRACGALADALRRIGGPFAETVATSIDYAMACLGERGAMVRVSDRLEALVGVELRGSPFLYGRLEQALAVTADTWRRLALSTVKERTDGFDLLSREIASHSFDLAKPWTIERVVPGIWMPAQSEKSRAAAAALAKEDTKRLRSRFGGTPRTVPAATLARESVLAPEAEIPEATDGAETAPTPETVFVRVLDRIGGGEGGSAEANYGHLLDPIPVIPSPDPDILFLRLSREFPWMREANEKAALAAAISSRRSERGFTLPPVVLVGPPGVGKSRWVRRLATLCDIPLHAATLAGASSSKSVLGSERGWASARPSLPALALSETRVANPVVLIDEADKSEASVNGDAISSLLPMIEKETAQRYPEAYLLGTLDLSRVSFVFTANSISRFSQPFLDRVAVVNVPKPGPKEFTFIAAALVHEAVAEYGLEAAEHAEASDSARREALAKLEAGGSLRNAEAAVRDILSKTIWSPPNGLKLVR